MGVNFLGWGKNKPASQTNSGIGKTQVWDAKTQWRLGSVKYRMELKLARVTYLLGYCQNSGERGGGPLKQNKGG